MWFPDGLDVGCEGKGEVSYDFWVGLLLLPKCLEEQGCHLKNKTVIYWVEKDFFEKCLKRKITLGHIRFDMISKYPLDVMWWRLGKGSGIEVREPGWSFKFWSSQQREDIKRNDIQWDPQVNVQREEGLNLGTLQGETSRGN